MSKEELIDALVMARINEARFNYELTLYMDIWNNEILAYALSSRRGGRMTFLSGLDALISLKEQYPQYEMILHSGQGAVYASKTFNELLPMYRINYTPANT